VTFSPGVWVLTDREGSKSEPFHVCEGCGQTYPIGEPHLCDDDALRLVVPGGRRATFFDAEGKGDLPDPRRDLGQLEAGTYGHGGRCPIVRP
jgi:hypothetical protein